MVRVFRNQILTALSDVDLGRLLVSMETVALSKGSVVEAANQIIPFVYFPESGVASVIALASDGRKMEAGPFGWDGMSGLAIVNEVGTTPHETVVEVDGIANRVRASDITGLMEESAAARRLFLRYSHVFAVQAAHTALAAGVSLVENRLARWLLMIHDRVEGDELDLTHAFMALMLSVRRPGVTVALHLLEEKGLIRSRRRRVLVRNRAGLERLCGGTYGVPEAEYRRLFAVAQIPIAARRAEAVT